MSPITLTIACVNTQLNGIQPSFVLSFTPVAKISSVKKKKKKRPFMLLQYVVNVH